MSKCEENLAIKWGIPKSWAVDPQPHADPRSVFTGNDFPSTLIEGGQGGYVRNLIKLDDGGRVAGCGVIELEGAKLFAEVTCAIIKQRVKFTPAKDANGQPVSSYYVTPRVIYALEW